MIQIKKLRARFGIKYIENVSITPSQCIAVVGPNGAGKSTFLRLLFGRLSPVEGTVDIDGVQTDQMTVRQRLEHMSYLPSNETLTPGLTVFDSVALGFHATQNVFTVLSDIQKKRIEDALERVSLSNKSNISVRDLSSGEYQRVRLARLFVQPAPIMILDEPFAFLDPRQALKLMENLTELKNAGKTIIMSLHQLNHAARSCDRIIVIDQGQVVLSDDAHTTLNSDVLRSVFGVDFVSVTHPHSQKTHLLLPNEAEADPHA